MEGGGKGRGHGLVHSCSGLWRPEGGGRGGLRAGPRERDGRNRAAAPVRGREGKEWEVGSGKEEKRSGEYLVFPVLLG